ncbi:hypothetical protein CRYUN_Cryun05aG0165700 [Craigia yunnanensis]
MGPIRGFKRRKKAADKKMVDHNVLPSSATVASSLLSQPQPLDWWDEFSKRISGPLPQSKDSKSFESFFRISRKTFNYICSLVKEDMMARQSSFSDINGKPLSLNDQVAVALRRLSSGESLSIIGDTFGMNQSTVSQITWRFVEAMEERGLHHLNWPSTEAEMEQIKSKFEKIRGLPNCCGAIDITHVVMTLATMDPSNNVWFDREKNYSMILQAVVDPEMRFRDVIAGWPGSLTDAIVLRSSGFYRLSEEGNRLNGKKLNISEGMEVREYIIGDAGFPLLPWLFTPYQGKGLSDLQIEFNKRHAATRMVAQMSLARLKGMWRIIHGVMWMPDKNRLPRIVLVCCLLHNILIDLEDEVLDDMSLSHHHDTGYRRQNSESFDQSALVTRDKLCIYLTGKQTVEELYGSTSTKPQIP